MIEYLDKIVGLGLTGLVAWLWRTVYTNNDKVVKLETKLDAKEKLDDERHKETVATLRGLKDSNDRVIERLLDAK